MDKLHLIMPMGGGGTRFGNKGFNVPKPLIELQGKPFFYWAAQSVLRFIEVADVTFVVLQDHVDRFNIDRSILDFYPDARIRVIPHVLNGAVLTCLEGTKDITDGAPMLFNDCDHAFICRRFYKWYLENSSFDADGALLTFNSDKPCFSYVNFDGSGRVIGTVEKQVVSSEAICGAYLFGNAELFRKYADMYLVNCEYNEFFVSGVYNEMAREGRKIKTFLLDEHVTFGTPDEYDKAINDKRLKELCV